MTTEKVTEQGIKNFLIEKFEQLLKSKEDEQKKIADEINDYAIDIIRNEDRIKLRENLWEILYGCLDLHHWGDTSKDLRPQYNKKEIRGILSIFKKRDRN